MAHEQIYPKNKYTLDKRTPLYQDSSYENNFRPANGRSYAEVLSEKRNLNPGAQQSFEQSFDKENFLLGLMRQLQETQKTMMALLQKETHQQQFQTFQMVPKPF